MSTVEQNGKGVKTVATTTGKGKEVILATSKKRIFLLRKKN